MKLWVDDLRNPPGGWAWAKTSVEALEYLARGGVTHMSLDHDLGGDDTTRPIIMAMCQGDVEWPLDVFVHSANPVGIDWLEGMIKMYKPRA